MLKRIVLLLLALAVLLCGCGGTGGNSRGGYALVYRLDSGNGGEGLVRERVELAEGELPLDKIVEALNSRPVDSELTSAFPEGVRIEQVKLKRGNATVTMSPDYMNISGVDRLLVNSAIVLSLSTLDSVCFVNIFCMGSKTADMLSVEDIAEADGICGEYERTVKLYLPRMDISALRPRSIAYLDTGDSSLAETILRKLFAYVGGGIEDTKLLNANISEGHCTLDLSQEFYAFEPSDSDEARLILYSMVNSLCRIPGVESVTITVEGMDVESYGGYVTHWPLKADMSLVDYQEN